MITLDQIKELDSRVKKAVEYISRLRKENRTLKNRLEDYELRIIELEEMINNFKQDQGEIERGIQKALEELGVIDSSTDVDESDTEAVSQVQTSQNSLHAKDDVDDKPDSEAQEAELDIF